MDVDGIGTYGEVDARGAQTVVGVVVHDIDDGDESRDIASCFARKVGVDLPEVGPAALVGGRRAITGACDGFVDIAGAAVVGGNGELPVTEDDVEVVEVAGGGDGGFVWVATVVDHGVDFEVIELAGGVHELPEAGSADARSSLWVHGALNNGEVFEFLGNGIAVEGFLEEGVVELAEGEHHIETGRHVLEIETYERADLVVVCERYDGMD